MRNSEILEIDNLSIQYRQESSVVHAVNDVSIKLEKGKCLGIVGESGCGKTTLVKAILGILPYNADVLSGSIKYRENDLIALSDRQMDKIRWEHISLVTQSAMNAFNPVARISKQMIEIFESHTTLEKNEIIDRCMAALEKVGINKNRFFDYPHQFSGGMRQRVVIAMAIALEPSIIIADEPTTALDVIMQAQIIRLLKGLSVSENISIIMITHNIAVVSELCDHVGVMYAGKLVEFGSIYDVFQTPGHPYTIGLQGAFPSIENLQKTLVSIPGSPPVLNEIEEKCLFEERCPFSIDICKEKIPPVISGENGRFATCHRTAEVNENRSRIREFYQNMK